VGEGDESRSRLFDELLLLREEIRRMRSGKAGDTDLRAVLENVGCAVCATTFAGRILYANSFFAVVHGVQRAECFGRDLGRFLDPGQRERLGRLLNGVGSGASYAAVSLVHRNRDGETFPMLSTLFPLPARGGSLPGMVMIGLRNEGLAAAQKEMDRCADLVSSIKETVKATVSDGSSDPEPPCAHPAEALLREAESLGSFGSWWFDVSTGVITWSDSLYRLLDRDPAQGPLKWEEYPGFFSVSGEGFVDAVHEAAETGERREWVLVSNVPGIGQRWLTVVINAVRDAGGGIACLFGAIQDISERKRLENRLYECEGRLRRQGQELEKKNVAMQELLTQLREIEDAAVVKARSALLRRLAPLLEEMRKQSVATGLETVTEIEKAVMSFSVDPAEPGHSLPMVLTPREFELCELIRKGLSTKEIADRLSISSKSVQTHRNHIRKKLGLLNRGINLTAYLQTHEIS
jgi:PAS domain S-box-containing protein